MLDAPGQLQLLSLPLEVPWETAVPRHGHGPPWPRAYWIGHRGGYQWAAQLDATHLEPGIHYEICIDLDGNLAYAMFTMFTSGIRFTSVIIDFM
jgi:hypothetical protein